MSCKKARSLQILGKFGIFPTTSKPGKIRVIGGALSRALHRLYDDIPKVKVNDFEVLHVNSENFI